MASLTSRVTIRLLNQRNITLSSIRSCSILSKTVKQQRLYKCSESNKNLQKTLFCKKFSTDSPSELVIGTKEHIEKLVKNNKIVVFMKGIPSAPQCGFSNAVSQIFRMHGVEDYDAHNVLDSDAIRQGIKDYSDWPTIPQVFFNGEFIGGCDILLQMHQGGDLIEELEKLGIKSALLEDNESEQK